MTTSFTYMQQFMDNQAKKSSYTLTELTNDGSTYTSYFKTKAKAKAYMRKNCSETSAIYIYQTKCVKIYDAIYSDDEIDAAKTLTEMNDTDYNPELDFSNMIVWKYGSGYLLEPPTDSDYFGQKYFHNGWWVPSQNSWFFKKSEYDWIIQNGATVSEFDEEDPLTTDLSSMTVWSYGKGYLLIPQTDDENSGEKYFHNGWWMPKQNGWFFKEDDYDWLIENGANLANDDSIGDVETDSEEEEVTHIKDTVTSSDLTTMTLWEYGKGYLLMPQTDDEHFGEKYFHSGWWMPKQNGWFFKANQYDWLIENGSQVSVEEDDDIEYDTPEFVEGTEIDLSSMTMYSYGKGYLIVPNTNDINFGEKYFHGGWWMPKQHGWFFKENMYDWLIETGVSVYSGIDTTEEKTTKTKKTVKSEMADFSGLDLSDMGLEEYKQGYLLKTSKTDKLYGAKYFMTGFWNKKQNGWFFKAKYVDELINMGAKLIKTEQEDSSEHSVEDETTTLSSSITEESFECVHGDSEFLTNEDKPMPKFSKYGKGWVLKSDKNYTYNGSNYYEGGWWRSDLNGWFFKTQSKNKFMTNHFSI
jgi:hypothetical protein